MWLRTYTVVILLCIPLLTYGHRGNTDSDGGHYNRATGTYHFHSQQQAPIKRNNGVSWLDALDTAVDVASA